MRTISKRKTLWLSNDQSLGTKRITKCIPVSCKKESAIAGYEGKCRAKRLLRIKVNIGEVCQSKARECSVYASG